MIVVIDTNVLLSAALRDRLPEKVVLHVAGDDQIKWIVTPEILAEYGGVLKRPKFKFSGDVLTRWMSLVEMRTVAVPETPRALSELRDPKDAPFLAVALANGADFLITGDQDLLVLRDTEPTRIVTPSEFAALHQVT